MNLAILHYHLNRGGVTRVIENQLRALDATLDPARPWNVALVFSGRRDDWSADLPEKLSTVKLRLHEIPSLDYDDQNTDGQSGPEELPKELTRLLDSLGFHRQDTVVHVHNHSLGKNAALPGCLRQLATAGYPLLMQIHDFAEDLRPANYRRISDPAALYPQAPHIHYAVLNGRDFEILGAAGVPSGRLHLLPNPVPAVAERPSREETRAKLAERFGVGPRQRYVFYPVRCIRRKNLGEALLLSALAPPDTVIALALAPLNPDALSFYEHWKRLAAELQLPCLFEVGNPGGLSFAENLAAADLLVTTSLAEGFGMVFLESWLADRPLVGRDLPEITADFAKTGVRLDWLHPRVAVPIDWIGEDAFRQAIVRAYRHTLDAYNRAEPENMAEQLMAKIDAGKVDFGDLDEDFQQKVIRTVWQNNDHRREVLQLNPCIEGALSIRHADATATIQRNRRMINENYALVPSGRRLQELYAAVLASAASASTGNAGLQQLPHGEKILDRLLGPSRFRMIRGA